MIIKQYCCLLGGAWSNTNVFPLRCENKLIAELQRKNQENIFHRPRRGERNVDREAEACQGGPVIDWKFREKNKGTQKLEEFTIQRNLSSTRPGRRDYLLFCVF